MADSAECKVKELTKGSASGAYRALMYGDLGLGKIVWAEILFTLSICIGFFTKINTKIFLRLSKWYYGVSCFFDLISK